MSFPVIKRSKTYGKSNNRNQKIKLFVRFFSIYFFYLAKSNDNQQHKKKASETFVSLAYCIIDLRLLYFINDSLERCGIVHSEVSENLTVNLDTCLVQCTHQL